jgi:NAD(P)-dependent dehydrogenase (short-subunit alcohol dehydrogenase family)
MRMLEGHAALVTGGTQGVGGAIAASLAKAGADVVIQGLVYDDRAEETLATCRRCNVRAELVLADLMRPTAQVVPELYEKACDKLPTIDLLVNNAGTYIDRPFLEMDWDTYDRTMRLNLDAGYFLTQAFARRWIDKQISGRILFTGSINGMLSEPDHTAYDASKGAVAALVRSLCISLAPHGIRVNAIAPGLIRTPLTNRVLDRDAESLAWMQLHTPNQQVPGPEVCGGAAVFLLSDAATHIHGQTLLVDGGMSASQQPDLPLSLRHAMRDFC